MPFWNFFYYIHISTRGHGIHLYTCRMSTQQSPTTVGDSRKEKSMGEGTFHSRNTVVQSLDQLQPTSLVHPLSLAPPPHQLRTTCQHCRHLTFLRLFANLGASRHVLKPCGCTGCAARAAAQGNAPCMCVREHVHIFAPCFVSWFCILIPSASPASCASLRSRFFPELLRILAQAIPTHAHLPALDRPRKESSNM